MEVRAPEAGLSIDRDMVLVTTIHQVLVNEFGARPITIKFLLDSQRINGIDGHYEAEYELKGGGTLRFFGKPVKDDMMFKVSIGRNQINYTVELGKYVNEDLVPISMHDVRDLVTHWFKD